MCRRSVKLIFLLFLIFTFGTNNVFSGEATIRYVALGDSYTIGAGAGQENSWPALLTRHLWEQVIFSPGSF